ncbi:MAG: hypothetical protein ACRD9R_11330 [Pyrinomonadaceae bacterium]
MSPRVNPTVEARRRRRRTTLIWSVGVVALVIGLIWKEQIALLYVLATLSVSGLLVVVALADLSGARARNDEASPRDDSAAIADGTSAVSAGRR